MKNLLSIFFTVLTIALLNHTAFAQKGRTEEQRANDEYQESSISEAEQRSLKDLSKSKNPYDSLSPKEREELDKKVRIKTINGNIEELNKASAALSATVLSAQNDKSAKKKTAKLANKIAKLSKDLRKDIARENSVEKTASALPTSTDKINGLVESIDKLVKEVTQEKDRLLYTSDLALVKESSKKLEAIESQALGIADLLR